jgi:hypothetical protein
MALESGAKFVTQGRGELGSTTDKVREILNMMTLQFLSTELCDP